MYKKLIKKLTSASRFIKRVNSAEMKAQLIKGLNNC